MDTFSKILENKTNWKIGLDLHGVIDAMPEFFSFFTNILVNGGCEVHIITGGATKSDMELLQKYNIKYTHIFSIKDYHTKIGTPTTKKHPVHGFMMVSDEEWDKTKGDYCRRNNIDLHIDDTIEYNRFFTTPFCQLWLHK